MKIVAIVVTFNGQRWIEKCLDSLVKSTVPLQIVVIDNGSADDTTKLIENHFSDVTLIKSPVNLGFGQANNIGLKMALKDNADYVFLLNQDAWVEENTIQQLISVAENHKEYGILSPFHVDTTHKKLERQFRDFLSTQYNEELISDMFFDDLKEVYATSYIHAASWLISRQCLETVGGFDSLYFHYGEDDDYLMRAKFFGFQIGLVPSALVVHDAAFKSWDLLEGNVNRNIVNELRQLKKMSPHFRSNLLLYIKSSLDEITSLLLFRKFKKCRFRLGIMYKTLVRYRTIHSSYKASFSKRAFLD